MKKKKHNISQRVSLASADVSKKGLIKLPFFLLKSFILKSFYC